MNRLYMFKVMQEQAINNLLSQMYKDGFELVDAKDVFTAHGAGTYMGKSEKDLIVLAFCKSDKCNLYSYKYLIKSRGDIVKRIAETNELLEEISVREGKDVFRVFIGNSFWVPQNGSQHCSVDGIGLLFKNT